MFFDAYADTAGIRGLIVLACAVAIAGVASSAAQAQCPNPQLHPGKRVVTVPQPVIVFGRDINIWKTIAIGTFAGPLELRNRLDDLGCHVGDQAGEILARPAFALAPHKAEAELVLVTPAQLGFTSETVTLADLYARARQVGIELARPEIGPQLRIQYFDQPMGEFLAVGMEPVRTWNGELIIFNLANGGAGLILIGQDGRPEAEVPATTRFVFERANRPASNAEAIDRGAALLAR